jgi:hypothetical protein
MHRDQLAASFFTGKAMLNKQQTTKLARGLNQFAQAIIKSGVSVSDLETCYATDKPLPIKQHKLFKHIVETVIGEYMAVRAAGGTIAVVYESTNSKVPSTAFGPFASSYEANAFSSKYESQALLRLNVWPGVVDLVPLRDPTWAIDSLNEAIAEHEEDMLMVAAEPPREAWPEAPDPFWQPPATTAEVPVKLEKEVETFLDKAAETCDQLRSGDVTKEVAAVAFRRAGERLAKAGGGWGALSYAFWRLRYDGMSVETIHKYREAEQSPMLLTAESYSRFVDEKRGIANLRGLLPKVLHGWAGIAGWAP